MRLSALCLAPLALASWPSIAEAQIAGCADDVRLSEAAAAA